MLRPNEFSDIIDVSKGQSWEEWLFLNVIREMVEKLRRGDTFSILQASGLLRLLLLDHPPLLDVVNVTYKKKLEFVTLNSKFKIPIKPDLQWINPDISGFPSAQRESVDINGLCQFKCLEINGEEARVQDIIETCANMKGGVHFYKNAHEKRRMVVMKVDEIFKIMGEEPSLVVLGGICRIVLEGTWPLVKQIQVGAKQT